MRSPGFALLLEYLASDDPSAGWRNFLDPESGHGIAWSQITVAGHSQGGGHAAYLATEFAVDRALLFGATEPQPWTANGSATPPERYFGLAHRDERSATAITMSWVNLANPRRRHRRRGQRVAASMDLIDCSPIHVNARAPATSAATTTTVTSSMSTFPSPSRAVPISPTSGPTC